MSYSKVLLWNLKPLTQNSNDQWISLANVWAFYCTWLGWDEQGDVQNVSHEHGQPQLTRPPLSTVWVTPSSLSSMVKQPEPDLTWRGMRSYYGQICVKAQALTHLAKGASKHKGFLLISFTGIGIEILLRTLRTTDDERVAISSLVERYSVVRWPTQYAWDFRPSP